MGEFLDEKEKKQREKFEFSWQQHMCTYAAVLENAFESDISARMRLCKELDIISRVFRERSLKLILSAQGHFKTAEEEADYIPQIEAKSAKKLAAAVKRLSRLLAECKSESDEIACYYVMAIAAEAMGDTENKLRYYSEVCKRNVRWYLPYMKLARGLADRGEYEKAKVYYEKAIPLLKSGLNKRVMGGTAYADIAYLCTKLKRYEEAEAALEKSHECSDYIPNRGIVEALLYAATGKPERVQASLAALAKEESPYLEQTRELAEKISAGEDVFFEDNEVRKNDG
ncbi:MAG: tetratricopeptide repeat protein [Clostridia bacterium]|nr:tetratricopeptide repeat protein [Clostridia bacterium]